MNGLQSWAAQVAAGQLNAEQLTSGFVHPAVVEALRGVLRSRQPCMVARSICSPGIAGRAARAFGLHCMHDRYDDRFEFRLEVYGPNLTPEEKSRYEVIR